jgi:DNA-binding HxlR family transcriptional regulator
VLTLKRRNPTSLEKEFFVARPIKPDLGVLGRKWALLILVDIGLRQVDRFSGLLRSNPMLNSRILSRRLRELEEAGMIRRIEKKGTRTCSVGHDRERNRYSPSHHSTDSVRR